MQPSILRVLFFGCKAFAIRITHASHGHVKVFYGFPVKSEAMLGTRKPKGSTQRTYGMTTFDLHIMKRFLLGTLTLIGALIVFFIVLHYVEYIDDFIDRGATMTEIFWRYEDGPGYYLSYIPEIVKLISPLAVFLSCVYLTGKLAQQLQLTAVQTSGVSLYRLMRPFVVVALLITGFMFWFNGYVVPKTNGVVLAFERKHMRDAPKQLDVNDIHRQNEPGSYVIVRFFDTASNVGYTVSLLDYDEGELRQRIDAKQMQWIDSLRVWRMSEPEIRSFDANGRERLRAHVAKDTTLNLEPRHFARTERDVESMTIPVATDYVDMLQRTGVGNLGQTLVAYYTKFSYPLANLIVVLIAVPLAAVRRRGGQAVRIGLGLLVAFAYLAIMKLTEPLGYSGTLSPIMTAWLPHAVFFAGALLYLFSVRK